MIYHHRHGGPKSSLDDLSETVKQAVTDLRPHVAKFDSIIATGMSGVIVAAPVAVALDKPLVVLRKEGEPTHDYEKLLNRRHIGCRTLWLDDFVSMGETRARVDTAAAGQGAHIIADYLYAGGGDYTSPVLSWSGA